MNYTVTTPYKLHKICVDNAWFTCGTKEQYHKLVYGNENGCPIEEIATIIWLCSDDEWCRRDILAVLKEAHKEYLACISE